MIGLLLGVLLAPCSAHLRHAESNQKQIRNSQAPAPAPAPGLSPALQWDLIPRAAVSPAPALPSGLSASAPSPGPLSADLVYIPGKELTKAAEKYIGAEQAPPMNMTLMKRLKMRGLPSCRQFAAKTCPGKALFESLGARGPDCTGGPTIFRSSTVSNWFYYNVPKPRFAIDLATGCRGLRSSLPPTTEYIPPAAACNYNEGLLPRVPEAHKGDTQGAIVALGVLEQVCDLPAFLEALKSYYMPIVVSYSPVDFKGDDTAGRTNSLTTGQWRSLLKKVRLGEARHEARVNMNGAAHLLYWFDPNTEWVEN